MDMATLATSLNTRYLHAGVLVPDQSVKKSQSR